MGGTNGPDLGLYLLLILLILMVTGLEPLTLGNAGNYLRTELFMEASYIDVKVDIHWNMFVMHSFNVWLIRSVEDVWAKALSDTSILTTGTFVPKKKALFKNQSAIGYDNKHLW